MFAASVFIAMVKFFLCISFDLQKERTKERKNRSSVIESKKISNVSLVSYAIIRSARERRAEGPCVKAILAVLFSIMPSWRWPLLGLF